MDRRIYMLMLFVLAGGLLSCSGSGYREGHRQITGVAVMVGNEPFAVISLQGTDGNTYRLQADSLTLSVFRQNQGREFRITGNVKKEPTSPVLQVETFAIK